MQYRQDSVLCRDAAVSASAVGELYNDTSSAAFKRRADEILYTFRIKVYSLSALAN